MVGPTERSSSRGEVIQRQVPPTKVSWKEITLTDNNVPPNLTGKVPTSFTLGSEMDADPLSTDSGGLVGSGPKGKSDWWPFLQQRHKLGTGLYWVQGHLLNDNVHGPGEPANLTPLSNTSNTNMETNGERAIKKAVVNQKKVVHYKVWAEWRSPSELHNAYGMIADGTGSLLWGEQFAPIGINWAAWEKVEQPVGSGTWVDGPVISQPAPSWYNTFPQPGTTPTPQSAPKNFAVSVAGAKTQTGCRIQIKGSGFTTGGHVTISFFGIPRTGEKSPGTLTQAPVVGFRGPEPIQGAPQVVAGDFVHQEDFNFMSTDQAHKFLNVQVIVRDDATGLGDVKTLGAGLWVQ